MEYLFITQHKNVWSVTLQCGVLGVSRSSYYNHLKTQDIPSVSVHGGLVE
jgi:hypothetical protein